MKRLIKYHSPYKGVEFSDCSTRYELYPIVVEDSAGEAELKQYAKELGLKNKGEFISIPKDKWRKNLKITECLTLNEKVKGTGFYSKDSYQVYLGFITIPQNRSLKLNKGIDKALTKEQAWEIVNSQSFGVDNVGEIDKKTMLVMSGWEYYHELRVYGYSLKSLQSKLKIAKDELYFSDSVNSCGECGAWDHNDDGHQTNFRILDNDFVGVNCGCYSELSKKRIEFFVDNTDNAMELDTAKELEDEGKIEFVERFIGGMVDGRGGSYGGERTREGSPAGVLKEYNAKYPDSKFIFTHDESGQFQTYFSIWKLKSKTKSKTKLKAV